MAKSIAPTPELTGPDADAVLRELEQGTPLTPERLRIFEEAERNFAKHQAVFLRGRSKDIGSER